MKFFSGLADGSSAKFIVSVLTAVAASLPVYFGTAHWVPVVVMAIGAVSTYLVPNKQPSAEQPHLMP